MNQDKILGYIEDVLKNMPTDWLDLTTHRLDIYDESQAKVQFLDQFETLYKDNNAKATALDALPTAFDYIRLGHPLSCILEWTIAHINGIRPDQVISFSSQTIAVLAILRKNLLDGIPTQINYALDLPGSWDTEVLRSVYGYEFDLRQVDSIDDIKAYDGSSIYIAEGTVTQVKLSEHIDFAISTDPNLGCVVLVGERSRGYISDIQHVRRRETIAMTPTDCLVALQTLVGHATDDNSNNDAVPNQSIVEDLVNGITGVNTKIVLGSSGLSIQYAITMGLIHDALEHHIGKAIKIIVPTNCYGGTNDQARRVAACLDNVEVVDLSVDGGTDMVDSIDAVLDQIAEVDAIPYIIAEIPTNPRVEVPELIRLKDTLSKKRYTPSGSIAVDPVFILDQTFCPNVHFLGEGEILSTVRTIAYVSGSKFPSGGRCTAGYCVANRMTEPLMKTIQAHLELCGNTATSQQLAILATQMPSMIQRIDDAYKNTRALVNHIKATLPAAKINFVSEELAAQGFTPSVFSLDLPTQGSTDAERETYKRALNLKLINLMISEIPSESKFCVSYGQLKGCYWTIPATSTQGTTKEGDKDYIVRVSISPDMDVERHKAVFSQFVEGM